MQRRRLVQQVDLPVGGVSSTQTEPGGAPAGRRWPADPLVLLGLLAVVAAGLALTAAAGSDIGWWPPALVGVIAAGLSLSGST